METRSIIDRIEIDPQTGNIGVRIRKQIVDDQGRVLSSDYHRTTIDAAEPDPAAQMSVVNEHLGQMGYSALKSEDRGVLDSALTHFAPLRAQKAQDLSASAAVELQAAAK